VLTRRQAIGARDLKLSEVMAMTAEDVVESSVASPLTHRLRVRYGECDPQGVVFNAHFLAYFDIGVTELFRAAFDTLGGYQAIAERGLDFVVAEAGLRYHRPAHFDDELTLEIAITRLGMTSMTTGYRVVRDEELLVDGTLRHVLVELKRLLEREADTKTTIPDWMRERLAAYVVESPAP
jgi:acyl-CoA thioester hydrolase